MSWTVNGTTYHDRNEYLRARAASEARQASVAASRYQQDAASLRSRLAGHLNSDIASQQRIVAENRRIIEQLRRVESRLAEQQRQHRARMEEIAEEARRGDERTRAEVAALSDKTDEMFSSVWSDLSSGLADAERRRAEMETRLAKSVKAVDDKVEADRRARLEKEQTTAGRARLAIDLSEQRLAIMDERELARLKLSEHRLQAGDHIAHARALVNAGDFEAGLAQAIEASTMTAGLERTATSRGAELQAASRALAARVAAVRERLSDAQVSELFSGEIKEISGRLGRIEADIARGFREYGSLEVEQDRLDRELVMAENISGDMYDIREDLANRLDRRARMVPSVVEQLKRTYGDLTSEPKVSFANQDLGEDKKSDLVVEMEFGGGKVKATFDAAGGFQIDGYRHSSNTACARSAVDVVGHLSDGFDVAGEAVVSSDNRQTPLSRTHVTPGRDAIADMRRIRGDVRRFAST